MCIRKVDVVYEDSVVLVRGRKVRGTVVVAMVMVKSSSAAATSEEPMATI